MPEPAFSVEKYDRAQLRQLERKLKVPNRTRLDQEVAVHAISALAAWRVTKGIYLFDETVFDALWSTEVQGVLPVELLQRLPEWCIYVPFPLPKRLEWGSRGDPWSPCYGFFGYLDWTGGCWLQIILDTERPDPPDAFALDSITLRLEGNLSECCAPFRQVISGQIQSALQNTEAVFGECIPKVLLDSSNAQFKTDATEKGKKQEAELIRPIVSILLWLCSADPEISGLDPYRGLRTKKTKKGIHAFGPDEPRLYEVAYRIGAALRLSREAIVRGAVGDGSHASPRPHIRRAHWHSYWTGPKASITKERDGDRKLVLKWIAPIAVCVGTDDTVIPTVHPVRLAG